MAGSTAVVVQGYLLQEVRLANDDSLLVFLTRDLGKIKVFASKLQRSKTKRAELDYFRSLELTLWRSKDTFKLRGVCAQQDYSAKLQPYARAELSFVILKELNRFCPEETSMPEFFDLLEAWWSLNDLDLTVAEVFFYTKLLWLSGILPRFDAVRQAVWVDVVTLEFFVRAEPNCVGLTNHQRQMLEWVRRSEPADLLAKQACFIEEDWQVLRTLVRSIVKNH